MSNRTVKGSTFLHGRDPQLLVEKILREKIYDSLYWKEECFGLNAESILDKAVELVAIGTTVSSSSQRPSPFVCLLLKLLQLQPTHEIILFLMEQRDFKYVTALAMVYWRMVAPPIEVYGVLESFLPDRRRIRVYSKAVAGDGDGGGGDGDKYEITHIDSLADDLLRKDTFYGLMLPRIPTRIMLEDLKELEERCPLVDINNPLNLDVNESVRSIEEEEKSPSITSTATTPIIEEKNLSLTKQETNALRLKLGLKPLT